MAPASQCFSLVRLEVGAGKGFWKSLERFAFFLGLEQAGRGMRVCRTSDISQQNEGSRICWIRVTGAVTKSWLCCVSPVHELRGRCVFIPALCHGWKGQSLLLEWKSLCRDNCTVFFTVISWLERELRGLIFTGGEIFGVSCPGFAEQEQGEGRLVPAGALVRGKLPWEVCSAFLRMGWGVGFKPDFTSLGVNQEQFL